MGNNNNSIQDSFLSVLKKAHTPVHIFLVNGIKLHGYVDSFDMFSVVLKNSVDQLVYKHAISTIIPTKSISFHKEVDDK